MSTALARFARFTAMAATIGLLAPAAAQAQAGPDQPVPGSPEFAKLLEGRRVILTTMDDAEIDGVVTSVSATGVVFGRREPAREVPFGRIRKIEKPSYRIRRGTLIGLAVGTGLGIREATGSCSGSECRAYLIMLGAAGAGFGAYFGAMNHLKRGNKDVIYVGGRSRTATFVVAPILSPTRKGAALAISWR